MRCPFDTDSVLILMLILMLILILMLMLILMLIMTTDSVRSGSTGQDL